ncbi:MAG: hypothetical protein LBR05_00020 [Azoarcus sp.]|jgi:hypothetical protein|nr:hypothetical protein [Azoarcus sp.]
MDHAIVIDRQGLAIWRQARGLLARELALAGDDADAPLKLRHWLAAARRRCTVVADLADERHAIERLPRASRADRRQLIRRRLDEHFPDAGATGARPLPARPEDGLLQPVLLAALTRPPLLTPWLETLGEAGAQGRLAVRRFTSVPFLLERWYRRQRLQPAHALLLAPGAGGMRQTFFRHRRLAFSRVIPAHGATLADNLPAYRDELAQTLAWLAAQRLCDGPPALRVLAAGADWPLLREMAGEAGDRGGRPYGGIEFIDLAAHLHGAAANDKGDVLALALREARRGGALGQYECPQLRQPLRLARARRTMVAVTVALSGAALAAGALELVDASGQRHAAEALTQSQSAQQNELATLEAAARAAPPADELAHWLDDAERLAHAPIVAPTTVLQAVAAALADAPWARLDALSWSVASGVEINLEIALAANAPAPQAAADTLAARWRQRHGTTPRTRVDADAGRVWLDATLVPPAATAKQKEEAP